MSDAEAQDEPSMEEILASIRKIIAEEDEPSGEEGESEPEAAAEPESEPAAGPEPETAAEPRENHF